MNFSNETYSENISIFQCGPGIDHFHQEYVKMHGWLSLLVCIFGSIANTLNIVVLTRHEMISPTNYILTGLAVADLLVMLEYIPYAGHSYLYHRPRKDMFTYGWALFVLVHSIFTQIFHTISIGLTLTLAIWRYIAVAYPQSTAEWCSSKRTVLTIIGTYLICPLICLPLYFTTEVQPTQELYYPHDNLTNSSVYNSTELKVNQTVWVVALSDTMKANSMLALLTFCMYSVVIKLIPCIALTILSLRLIKALMDTKKRRKLLINAALVRKTDDKVRDSSGDIKKSKKKSSRVLEKERQTDRTTKMLLAVLLLFLLTEFPQGVLGLLSVILGPGFFRTCYIKLGELMDILALINSAINFILYCAMSRQFRMTFNQLFCRWKLFGRWTPVPQRLENNGHTATTLTMTQVTQV